MDRERQGEQGANSPPLRDWHALPETERLALLEAYGHFLDGLPPTCSLETKVARFQRWLAGHGVRYEHPG